MDSMSSIRGKPPSGLPSGSDKSNAKSQPVKSMVVDQGQNKVDSSFKENIPSIKKLDTPKERFKSLVNHVIQSRRSDLRLDLERPIAYAYDPKATSGVMSKGLVSYELEAVSPDYHVGGKTIGEKLPSGKSLRIPKGFKSQKYVVVVRVL